MITTLLTIIATESRYESIPYGQIVDIQNSVIFLGANESEHNSIAWSLYIGPQHPHSNRAFLLTLKTFLDEIN